VGQPDALLALVNGDMAEAHEGRAWLEDTDEETFIRFGEYLYTGDYTPAEPIILLAHPQIEQESNDVKTQMILEHDAINDNSSPITIEAPGVRIDQLPEAPFARVSDWDNSRSKKKKREKKQARAVLSWDSDEGPETSKTGPPRSKRELLWDEFIESTDTHDRDPRRSSNEGPCEDYRRVFLCHAQLYVFADKYDIRPLSKLSLSKLRHTLTRFNLYEERKEDIVELLKYCYANTPDRVGMKDKLRALVIKYVACVVEILQGSEEFHLLLGEANSVSSDLTTELCKRLD